MRGRDLLDAMEYIDDVLVEEAARAPVVRQKRTVSFSKWAATAAGVVVLCVSAVALYAWQSARNMEDATGSGAAVSSDMAPAPQEDSGGVDTAASYSDAAASEGVDAAAEAAGAEAVMEEAADEAQTPGRAVSSEYDAAKQDVIFIDDFPPKEREPSQNNMEAKDYDAVLEAEVDYKMPEKGTYFYALDLSNAMEYYEGADTQGSDAEEMAQMEYRYYVVIEVFGDRAKDDEKTDYGLLSLSEDGRELLTAEYSRLLEAGYDVSLSEEFELTGTFSKEELDAFDVSPDYGYLFRFSEEGLPALWD